MPDFKLAANWLEKIAKIYSNSIKKRRDEIDKIADELLVNPESLVPYFIEPDIQPFNPANEDEEEDVEFRVPAFKFVETFIRSEKSNNDGRHQLFLLSDAGMGKTSLLAMLKLAHANSFWPTSYKCEAFKLGPDTIDRLSNVKSRGRTVLFLDALDEDPASFGRVKDRIIEILRETQNFYRVIITCRTQFFPKTEDRVFFRQDRVRIRGFYCPVKYLSLFSDDQIRDYLARKVPPENVRAAFEIVNHMGDLRCRPMLLAYIEDLLG
ncbi:MAG: hypothetical protein QNK37_03855 [Acidobacteriota bacterium]|nr:hypothetical protein [Acidobacteriota bacterium]